MIGRRRKIAALGVVGLLLGTLLGLHLLRRSLDAEAANGLLENAQQLIDSGRQVGLAQLAPDAFTLAEDEVERARTLLESGKLHEALPRALSALELADTARRLALGERVRERAASLKSFRGDVLHRQSEAVSWVDAQQNMSLYQGDRIATRARSEAVLSFDEGNDIRVEPESVVVVRMFTENRLRDTLDMEVTVSEGSVRSKLGGAGGRVRMALFLPNTDIVIDTGALGTAPAEIAARAAPDGGGRISVLAGRASLETATGEKLMLEPNTFTEVGADGTLAAPQPLPAAARTSLPTDGETLYVSDYRPEITLRWEAPDAGCVKSHVQLASEVEFFDKIVDETTDANKWSLGELADGTYYWRVSCLNADQVEGAASPMKRFDVRRDSSPPEIEILVPRPRAILREPTLETRCRAEPSLEVFVNGQKATEVAPGEYVRRIKLEPGLNRVVFDAVDGAGNATRARQFVTRAGP